MYKTSPANVIPPTFLKVVSPNFLEYHIVPFRVELCCYVVGIWHLNTTTDDW